MPSRKVHEGARAKREAEAPREQKTVVVRIYDEKTGALEQEHKGLDFVQAVMHGVDEKEREGIDQFDTLLKGWGAFQIGHTKHIKDPAPLILALVTALREVINDYGSVSGRAKKTDGLEAMISSLVDKKLQNAKSAPKKKK